MARVLPFGPAQAAERPDKDFATAQARGALAGCVLRRVEDDAGAELFIVSRGAMTRHFSSLIGVAALIDRLEAKTRR